MALNRKSSAIGRLRGSYNLIIFHAPAKLERTIRMSSPIARILHFSFETAEDLNLWVMKYETETSERLCVAVGHCAYFMSKSRSFVFV